MYNRMVRSLKANLRGLGPEQVTAGWQSTPEVPEYLADYFEKVLLTSNLLGQATFWQDLMDRGLRRWAKKQREAPAGLPFMALSEPKLTLEAIKEPEPGFIPAVAATGTAWIELKKTPPVRGDRAYEWFKKKVPMTRPKFDMLNQAAKSEAFTIAGSENIALIAQVKEVAQRSIIEGITQYEFSKEVTSLFETAGVTPTSKWHLETVFRTNIGSAYNAARWQQTFESPSEAVELFVPYLQYSTTGSANVCEICKPYDGRIYRRDDPIWDTIYPPLHYNCECIVAPVSVLEVEAEGLKPDTIYPDSPGPIKGFDGPPSTLGRRG